MSNEVSKAVLDKGAASAAPAKKGGVRYYIFDRELVIRKRSGEDAITKATVNKIMTLDMSDEKDVEIDKHLNEGRRLEKFRGKRVKSLSVASEPSLSLAERLDELLTLSTDQMKVLIPKSGQKKTMSRGEVLAAIIKKKVSIENE